MSSDYVKKQDGTYQIGDTRVSLDSVIYAYHRGSSPEAIQRSYPSLTLEQIHGSLAFYLSHKQEIDEYLKEGEAQFETLQQSSRETHRKWHKLKNADTKNLVS